MMVWFFYIFFAKAIFVTAPAASKNDAKFKSAQKWLKINHLSSLIYNHATISM